MFRTAALRKILAEEGLIKTARETSWADVLNALRKADRAARGLGPEAEAAVDAWAKLDEDHSDRDFFPVQIAISEAVDPFYEDGQDRMAEKLMVPWRVLLDFRADRKLRSKGGKVLPVGIGKVKSVGITPRGRWFIDAVMRNTYRSPERWLYALTNEWQVPPRQAKKLFDQLKGQRVAAKAKTPAKLKGKKLDKEINRLFQVHGDRVQFDIFDLGKLSNDVKAAYEAGDDMEEAMKKAVAKYRKN